MNYHLKKTILSYGEMLWDILFLGYRVERKLPTETVLGGAPCNFAYRANSLGDSGIIASRLGKDDLGKKAFEQLSSLGLETTYIQWDDSHPTGTVPVTFDDSNNPNFTIIPDVAYDYIEMTDHLRDIASVSDCLCFGTVSQRSERSRQTLELILEISKSLKLLDINLRKDCYSPDTVIRSLEKADILKLNENELYEIAKMLGIRYSNPAQICEHVMNSYSLRYCVVTLGEKGVFGISDKDEHVYDAGYEVALADSVGAGDAFSAGFAHHILRGKTLAESCMFGNILGAIVCTKKGATATVTEEEIEEFKSRDLKRIHKCFFYLNFL